MDAYGLVAAVRRIASGLAAGDPVVGRARAHGFNGRANIAR